LRRSWPRWRDALLLATVDRWHRDALHRRWRRRSRRPGRPRIDSEYRALIQRLGGGKNLSARRRTELERAKRILQGRAAAQKTARGEAVMQTAWI